MTTNLTAGAMRLEPQWPTLKLDAACPFLPAARLFRQDVFRGMPCLS